MLIHNVVDAHDGLMESIIIPALIITLYTLGTAAMLNYIYTNSNDLIFPCFFVLTI
jgi:hypothetical protein